MVKLEKVMVMPEYWTKLSGRTKISPQFLGELRGVLLLVVPNPNIMSRSAEGIPGDVEPAGGGQELVGIFTGLEEGDEALELLRVLGADVGSLAKEVLRVLDATDKGVDARVAEA